MKAVTFGISSEAPAGSAAPFATEAREECCHCLQLQSRIRICRCRSYSCAGRLSLDQALPRAYERSACPRSGTAAAVPPLRAGQQPCGAAEGEHTGNRNRPMWQKPGRRHRVRRRLDTTALEVVETHLWPDGTTDSDGRILESYAEVGTERPTASSASPPAYI